MSYRLQFIDRARFMLSLSSNLVNNLAEEIHKTKCKCRYGNKKEKTGGINTKIASTVLNTQALKMI